jgi:hypothetical protein
MGLEILIADLIGQRGQTDSFINQSNNILPSNFTVNPLVQLINVILTIAALYLSFRCNKGFNFGSVLLACCCPIIYIPYRIAVPCAM